MPTIILVRHGDNDVYRTRMAGRLPGVHLNEHGYQQARLVADALAQTTLSAIYSSPLERAMETATPIAEARGLNVQICPALIEVDFGDWQGKTFKQLHRTKLWKQMRETPSGFYFPAGESLDEAQQRVCGEIERICSNAGAEDVIACVSHGDPIRLAVLHYMGMPLDCIHRLSLDTAALTVLTWKDGVPYLRGFNLTVPFKLG
jgi:probable phosphoglycerate mutase